MKKLVLDFKNITNETQLNYFLAEKLDLPSLINGEYGYNLAAFYDTFGYSDEEDFFELININSITEIEFKQRIEVFIEILNDLKKTNPNFGFVIVS